MATRTEEELKLKKVDGVIKSEALLQRPGFRMLVQLEEIIAEAMGSTPQSQKVKDEYFRLVTTLDTELKILTKIPLELIAMAAGEKLADGVKRVREGNLSITPGYDNTYGIVKIWGENETSSDEEQMGLF